MHSSRGRLSGSSVVLSGAFLAVWAAGALAQVPFAGGTWSFSGVIHSKQCGTSSSFRGGRRTVTRGCFPDGGSSRWERTLDIRPGQLPTLGPLLPCHLERGQREQLVRYVASRTRPRRFVLHINDRAALIKVFASCTTVPPPNRVPPQPVVLDRHGLRRRSACPTARSPVGLDLVRWCPRVGTP